MNRQTGSVAVVVPASPSSVAPPQPPQARSGGRSHSPRPVTDCGVDQAALDRGCDLCLSYTDIDLGIRGRASGLLARVLYPDLSDSPSEHTEE